MALNMNEVGQEIYKLISKLYPICRSITGDGLRTTLNLLREYIPLNIQEVPTGTKVFDWSVPKEWNIKDAYIKNLKGKRIVNFKESNLHVMSYSTPIHARVPLDELTKHLFTLPDHADWIPYRTSYYTENWGFCLSHNQFMQLKDEKYDVCIDSTLEDGHLTYGEYYLAGKTSDEILISTHSCHPSLCNDNLSGIALVILLAKHLTDRSPKRYSYRFLFAPATIGAITWLSVNRDQVHRIKHGLTAANVGDSGEFTYKKSRRGDAEIDKIAAYVLKHSGKDFKIIDFSPYGYDERQFSSPGFNLPVGSLTRSTHDCFLEYHTSADDLSFVRPEYLGESFEQYMSILEMLENNFTYFNQSPYCEPQLGRRGLYRTISGHADSRNKELPMLWVLNMSDGIHTLLDIADRSGLEFDFIKKAADMLLENGLLKDQQRGRG